ncbi:ABC transporter permease [Kocuria marina]|uniref:ABC transporter permease n=1 Tax=Kocuria marina TaxID=223184 RepID=UPI0022E56264|nr:ABC transporter permease [Kocuria marina]
MNLTYTLHDFWRQVRDIANMFFIAVLPAALFIMFGVTQGWSGESSGHGNVSAYLMVSMAAYGAVDATTSIAGSAAVERLQGWGRQLAMTPMGTGGYAATKVTVAVSVAVIPVIIVYLAGLLTNSTLDDLWRWFATAGIVVASSSVFALYGLAAGLLFRSDGAVSAASGLLVVLAFLGNVFMPLSGALLDFARFTPLYGIVGLARYPITEGWVVAVDGTAKQDSVWLLLANVGVWAAIFGTIALIAARRATARR